MPTKLSEAYAQLCAVVRPRADMTEETLGAAARRLYAMLGEYPEPVALTALDLWPRRSEWFPTEKELRDLCEEVAVEAAHEAAARGPVGDGMYLSPVGRTVAFVERVRNLRGADYVKSWLAGGINCKFSSDTVYTTGIGAERLTKDCWLLLQDTGVAVKRSAACRDMLNRYCEERSLTNEPKRGRR